MAGYLGEVWRGVHLISSLFHPVKPEPSINEDGPLEKWREGWGEKQKEIAQGKTEEEKKSCKKES